MIAAAPYDARTTLARPDLAALALEGLVPGTSYRATRPLQCAVPVADIHSAASAEAERIDQLLAGEEFDGLAIDGGWTWGQARRDGTVGWVRSDLLTPAGPLATHCVVSPRAALPLNALVSRSDADVAPEDLRPIGDFAIDPVAVAESLLGVPHSLGARSSVATDCSGLVQQALYACGLPGPRHSDQQAQLGVGVSRAQARRGDIVVWLNRSPALSWTGHSAFMLDAERVIHATGFHGAVVVEDMATADERYLADGFQPAVFRRLP